MSQFPQLPIVTIAPPRKTQAEKYGGLFYLGIGGLVCLLLLVGMFGYGLWTTRTVWSDIYLLNDTKRSEADRVNAAFRLSRHEQVNQRQRWDLALNDQLPDLARYILAESLTSDLVDDNPRAYGMAVARSEGWPVWLRILLARPLLDAAAEGTALDREPLEILSRHDDPVIKLFADFALSTLAHVQSPEEAGRMIDVSAAKAVAEGKLAKLLDEAAKARQPRSAELLDEATALLRTEYSLTSQIWSGWQTDPDGKLVRAPMPQLGK